MAAPATHAPITSPDESSRCATMYGIDEDAGADDAADDDHRRVERPERALERLTHGGRRVHDRSPRRIESKTGVRYLRA